MKLPYKNLSGHSGIRTYDIPDRTTLILEFIHTPTRYVYNATTPGVPQVTEMIRLAEQGRGLATYVSQHIQKRYAARIPEPSQKAVKPPDLATNA